MDSVRYFHLSSLRAGVVKSLEDLERYPWCGHGVLTGRWRNDWQERGFVLSFLGSREKIALRAHRDLVETGKGFSGSRYRAKGSGHLQNLLC